MASSPLAEEVPVMQVLDKAHYFTQALVPVPAAVPYPPLAAPSSLRLRTRVVSLTHNNVTYAALGFLVHWWDAHPLPAGGLTPSPYDDAAKYGRVSAWGYAEVLESTLSSSPGGGGPQRGDFVFGYLPLATLAQDLEFRLHDEVPGHLVATSAHRARLMPFYNNYVVVGRGSDIAAQLRAAITDGGGEMKGAADGLGFDALYGVLFECGHLVTKFMFDAARPIHPGMGPDAPAKAPWTGDMADLTGATVVLLAPASKTALGTAFEMQKRVKQGVSGAHGSPKRVVGAASEASRAFVEGTGLYDATVSTAETPDADFLAKLGVDAAAGDKVVLIDCGGRAGVGKAWAAAFRPLCQPGRFVMVGIGSEAGEHSPADVLKRFAPEKSDEDEAARGEVEAPWYVQVNTGDLRQRAADQYGWTAVFEGADAAYAEFKRAGVRGFKIRWGAGMGAVAEGWERLAKGRTSPEEGMAFLL